MTLPQLRQRMPALQKQAQAVGTELQSLEMAAVDEARYLQLSENLAGFRSKLRSRADTMDIAVRQQILRLVVKEVLVGTETITLRHSLPIPRPGPESKGPPNPLNGVTRLNSAPNYLLRSGSPFATAQQPRTRRTRPGAGAPGSSLRSICGRLQYLRSQRAGGATGDGEHNVIHHDKTQAQGE